MSQASIPIHLALRLGAPSALALLLLILCATPVVAQDASSVTADEVNDVARELWCPLCAGVRLDGCELKACDQMKDEIAIRLAEGDDTDSIKNYFVAQYGPQVLGEPPREGFNLLAWVLPFVVLLGGGLYLVSKGRNMLQSSPVTGAESAPQDMDDGQDRYERRLEEELASYD